MITGEECNVKFDFLGLLSDPGIVLHRRGASWAWPGFQNLGVEQLMFFVGVVTPTPLPPPPHTLPQSPGCLPLGTAGLMESKHLYTVGSSENTAITPDLHPPTKGTERRIRDGSAFDVATLILSWLLPIISYPQLRKLALIFIVDVALHVFTFLCSMRLMFSGKPEVKTSHLGYTAKVYV